MNILDAQTIPVAAIGCDRSWSLHRDLPEDPDPDLIESIKQFGIIHPPILRPDNSGRFELICGAYRFKAAIEILQQSVINCLLAPSSLPEIDLLHLALEDQSRSGPLSPIEKARLVLLGRRLLDPDTWHGFEISHNLGSRRQLDRLTKLVDLEKEARLAIHHGLIPEKVGLELLNCEPVDRELLCELFVKLRLNRNKQRRLMDMGRVIMALEGKSSFMECFTTHFPDYINQSEPINPPQAAQLLLRNMQQLSSPLSSHSEERFKAHCAELDLPSNCTMTHSKSFESDGVTLQVRFKDFEEFRQKWIKLRDSITGG